MPRRRVILGLGWLTICDAVTAAPPPGLRLSLHTDRRHYAWDQDLVNLAFTLHNDGPQPVELLLADSGDWRTSVRWLGAAGEPRDLPNPPRETSSVQRWLATVQPGRQAGIRRVIDPLAVGARPGRVSLQGSFRLEVAGAPALLSAWAPDIDGVVGRLTSSSASAHGPAVDGLRLSLHCDRARWQPGDPALNFAAVCHHLDGASTDAWLLSLIGPTYCRLVVKGPGGSTFDVLPEQARPASISPHFRLVALPPGRSLGQDLPWHPAGVEPGRYTVHALYEVDAGAEARHAYVYAAPRLVSNPLALRIGGEPRR